MVTRLMICCFPIFKKSKVQFFSFVIFILWIKPGHSEACRFFDKKDSPISFLPYDSHLKIKEDATINSELFSFRVKPISSIVALEEIPSGESTHFNLKKTKEGSEDYTLLMVSQPTEALRRNGTFIQLLILCKSDDQAEDTKLEVLIEVIDVNDKAPKFLDAPYTKFLNELTPPTTTLFLGIKAVDEDLPNTPNSLITYRIQSGNEENFFSLTNDSSSSNIVLLKPLDYESGQRKFVLKLKAEDQGNPVLSDEVDLTIIVEDADDQNPKFIEEFFTAYINEEEPVGTVITNLKPTNIQAFDQDLEINSTIKYSIKSGDTETFSVDSSTGAISINKILDKDNLIVSKFVLLIKAEQVDNPGRSDVATVEIVIEDINDNHPVFQLTEYSLSINENTLQNTPVIKVTADDIDQGSNGEFIYVLEDGFEVFTIDAATGWINISNSEKLDREVQETFILKVFAKEGMNDLMESSATVEITLIDVNDNNPKFYGGIDVDYYEFFVPIEQARVQETIGKVYANDSDKDDNGRIFFTLKNNDESAKIFTVHSEGAISLQNIPDKNHFYYLIIEAEDQNSNEFLRRSAISTVFVNVSFTINRPPAFTNDSYAINILEGLPENTFVIQIQATDPDNDALLYMIISGNEDNYFYINEVSGFITTTKELDRESMERYLLVVAVSDGTNIINTTLSIIVLDVNDNSPKFNQLEYSFNVVEEKPSYSVGIISADDIDAGSNAQISFQIFGSEASEMFSIDAEGLLSTKKALDRETVAQHSFPILAIDNGTPQQTSLAMVTINIEDINDHLPLFEKSNYSVTLKEGEIVQDFLFLKATDADDQNNENTTAIRFAIADEDEHLFYMNENTGSLSQVVPLDSNAKSEYDLMMTAFNIIPLESQDSSQNAISTTIVHINVEDINNHWPIFNQKEYFEKIVENEAVGTVLLKVEAVDDDTEPAWKQITYSISDGNDQDGKFKIDSKTGEIRLNKVLDYDSPQNDAEYELIVSAIDALSLEGDRATVKISIKDVNDNIPKFDKDIYTVKVNESMALHLSIITIQAIDLDSEKFGEISYEFTTNATESPFEYDVGTGDIYLKTTLDYDAGDKQFYYVLYASDDGSPPLTGSTTLLCIVENDNDIPPHFTKPYFNFTIPENMPENTAIGLLQALDEDNLNSPITYHLINDSNRHFKLENWESGLLFTSEALDREKIATYVLTIQASDGLYETDAEVIINVQDVNDNDPIFEQNEYFFSIPEEAQESIMMGNVMASDKDLDPKVYYSIQDAKASELFDIDEDGVIFTKSALDREKADQYSFSIVAVDNGNPSRSSIVLVVIEVLDINDNLPELESTNYEIRIKEGIRAEHFINIKATDSDGNVFNNSQVSYSIKEGDSNLFTVDSFTGSLSILEPLDYEAVDTHVIVVMAANVKPYEGPYKSALEHTEILTTITVYVEDINDNAPTFLEKEYTLAVNESILLGSLITSVEATDGDIDPAFRQLSYWISGGNDLEGKFYIDQRSGEIFIQKLLDYDFLQYDRDYELIISVTDMLSPLIDNTTVRIQIQDINDNSPTFEKSYYIFSVNESESIDSIIFTANAFDNDSGPEQEIIYSIEIEDNLENRFTIDDKSGDVKLQNLLDYDSGPKEYKCVVYAVDNGVPILSGSTSLFISVLNDNDIAPEFTHQIFNFSILENLPEETVVGSVQAYDNDFLNIPLIYSLLENESNIFNVMSDQSGLITLQRELDRELQDYYSFTVKASDGKFETMAIVNVHVRDDNDNRPVFNQSEYIFTVREEETLTKEIGKVFAIDDDINENAAIVYGLLNVHPKHSFNVTSTGEILIKGKINREESSKYIINVIAYDNGRVRHSGNAKVFISIQDINDNPPTFEYPEYSTHIQEDQEPYIFFSAKANDEDIEENAVIKYAIVTGNKDLFDIDEITGEITTKQKLNRNDAISYELTILAYNIVPYEGPHSDMMINNTVVLTIYVLDKNYGRPQFTDKIYRQLIPESTKMGEIITGVEAIISGSNETTSSLTYSIIEGNRDGKFSINPGTGHIWLVSPVDADPPRKDNVFELMVSASDLEYYNDTAKVNITVVDINDNVPEFPQSLYLIHVNETTAVNTVLLSHLKAFDVDSGSYGEITYGLQNALTDELPIATYFSETAELILTLSLDYESGIKEYNYILNAVDGGDPPLTGSTMIKIIVDNDNDNNPECTNDTYTFSVDENVGFGTFIGRLDCKDADDDKLLFKVIEGSTDAIHLNDITGDIYVVISNLDFENSATRSFPMLMLVSDGLHIKELKVLINVKDVNDNVPIFSVPIYYLNITEFDNRTDPLVQMKAVDVDSGIYGTVSHSLIDGDVKFFLIDSTDGFIKINPEFVNELDYDKRRKCAIIVKAEDGGHPPLLSHSLVDISILDSNNHPPRFSQKQYLASVKENMKESICFNMVSADSGDSMDSLTYSIENSDDFFSIHPDTGVICTLQSFDREQSPFFDLVISASDSLYFVKTSFNMTVLDENDNAPQFEEIEYKATIPENSVVGREIFHVSATDKDEGYNGIIMYHLEDAEDKFAIDSQSGTIRVAHKLYQGTNRKELYLLTLYAQDLGRPSLYTNISISIYINDTNRYTPLFDKFVYEATVPENTKGQTIITLTAVDPDPGEAGKIFYKLIENKELNRTFSIDANTGTITLEKVLDFEVMKHVELVVEAWDKAADPFYSSAIVQIIILDENDNMPEFIPIPSLIRIPISTPRDVIVYHVEAIDKDSSVNNNNVVQYRLKSKSSNYEINKYTGEIKVAVDSLNSNNETVTIIAEDQALNSLSSELSIVLESSSMMAGHPIFTQIQYERELGEQLIAGEHVTIVTATTNDDSTVWYNISAGNDDGSFVMDTNKGIISTTKHLDRENIPVYYLLISAYNKQRPELFTQTGVKINVLDISDKCPKFPFTVYGFTVPENFSVGSLVYKFEADDLDLYPKLEFTITMDNSHGHFTIQTVNNIGILKVSKPLNRETMPEELHGVYTLNISVSEGICIKDNASVKIFVEDINDNAPFFTSHRYNGNISEISPVGTIIMKLTAYDIDKEDEGNITYSIIEGNNNNSFIIQRASGTIGINMSLDREIISHYNLTIEAEDTNQNKNTTQVYLDILDFNDKTPEFVGEPYILSVYEGHTGIGQSLLLEAIDKDEGINANVTFSIIKGNDGDQFEISLEDGNKGIIKVIKELDREQLNGDTCWIVIRVEDGGVPINFATSTVTINVTDINDNPPKFERDLYYCHILDTSPVGLMISNVRANDSDLTINTNITYSFQQGLQEGPFKIDPFNGNITVAEPFSRKSSNSFHIIVVASDGFFNTSALLIIDLIKRSGKILSFNQSIYYFSALENSSSQAIGQVFVEDIALENLDEFLYYLEPAVKTDSIISDNNATLFFINDHGVIFVNESLDREKQSSYSFSISAIDKINLSRKGVCGVIINVLDVNDESPIFFQDYYNATVEEHSSILKITSTIKAVDADQMGTNNSQIYYVLQSPEKLPFSITSDGSLQVIGNIDREATKNYEFSVLAFDKGSPSKNSSSVVYIEVLDINDNPPKFHGQPYHTVIDENGKAGEKIIQLNVTDLDTGLNGKTEYEIINGDDRKFFIINGGEFDGMIQTLTSLDYEGKPIYNLTVIARDFGQLSLTTTTEVYITIRDKNDIVPVFIKTVYTVSISEKSPLNKTFLTVSAGEGNFTYLITGGDGNNTFNLDSVTGAIYPVDILNREFQARYDLMITASDTDEPPNTDSTMVKILIEPKPGELMFTHQKYSTVCMENQQPRKLIFDMNATDEIAGRGVTYSIIEGNTDIFSINVTTGEVFVEKILDREKISQYRLKIHVKRVEIGKHLRFSREIQETNDLLNLQPDEAILIIEVGDENDNYPIFNTKGHAVVTGISSDSYFGHELFTIEAFDLDDGNNSAIYYEIVNNTSDESDKFYIHPITGIVVSTVNIAREPANDFQFEIKATDNFGQGKTTFIKALVYVLTENRQIIVSADVEPRFIHEHMPEITSYLSELTDCDVKTSKIEPQVKGNKIYTSATDIYVYAVNRSINKLVIKDKLLRLLTNKLDEINRNLQVFSIHAVKSIKPLENLGKDITAAESALIALGIVVFLGTIVGCVLFLHSWKRKDKDIKDINKMLQQEHLEKNIIDNRNIVKRNTTRHSSGQLSSKYNGSRSSGLKATCIDLDGEDVWVVPMKALKKKT